MLQNYLWCPDDSRSEGIDDDDDDDELQCSNRSVTVYLTDIQVLHEPAVLEPGVLQQVL